MSTEETEDITTAPEQTKVAPVSPAKTTAATTSSYGPIIKKAIVVIILLAIAFAVYKFVIQKKLAAMSAAQDETKLLTMVSQRGNAPAASAVAGAVTGAVAGSIRDQAP